MAAATSVSISEVLKTPMRVIKGTFLTANNVVNTVTLPTGYTLNRNSVVLVNLQSAGAAVGAATGHLVYTDSAASSSAFSISFNGAAPAAGIFADFIIFG